MDSTFRPLDISLKKTGPLPRYIWRAPSAWHPPVFPSRRPASWFSSRSPSRIAILPRRRCSLLSFPGHLSCRRQLAWRTAAVHPTLWLVKARGGPYTHVSAVFPVIVVVAPCRWPLRLAARPPDGLFAPDVRLCLHPRRKLTSTAPKSFSIAGALSFLSSLSATLALFHDQNCGECEDKKMRSPAAMYSLRFGKWSRFGHDLSQTLGI
jgi:hypothetical protein